MYFEDLIPKIVESVTEKTFISQELENKNRLEKKVLMSIRKLNQNLLNVKVTAMNAMDSVVN